MSSQHDIENQLLAHLARMVRNGEDEMALGVMREVIVQRHIHRLLAQVGSMTETTAPKCYDTSRIRVTEMEPSDASAETCAVCLELMTPPDKTCKLACGHSYHGDCVTPWLRTRPRCPTCRESLDLPEVPEVPERS